MLKLVKKPGLAVEAKVSRMRPLQTTLCWIVAGVVLHHPRVRSLVQSECNSALDY